MPFMQSPVPLLMLVSAYLLFVRMSKSWMKHRKPMQIDHIIIAYNYVQIAINAIYVVSVGHIHLLRDACQFNQFSFVVTKMMNKKREKFDN